MKEDIKGWHVITSSSCRHSITDQLVFYPCQPPSKIGHWRRWKSLVHCLIFTALQWDLLRERKLNIFPCQESLHHLFVRAWPGSGTDSICILIIIMRGLQGRTLRLGCSHISRTYNRPPEAAIIKMESDIRFQQKFHPVPSLSRSLQRISSGVKINACPLTNQ